jgi:hypothetical protein
MESIQGIILGAQVLGHLELPSDGAVEHATECDTIDRAGMDAEPYDPARILIHDDQDPMGTQRWRLRNLCAFCSQGAYNGATPAPGEAHDGKVYKVHSARLDT